MTGHRGTVTMPDMPQNVILIDSDYEQMITGLLDHSKFPNAPGPASKTKKEENS